MEFFGRFSLLWELPRPALALVLGLFGSLFGSFLNALVWRLPQEISLWRRGSACPNCARPIRPWENIPVLSFLFLRGRCAGCKLPISWRYPLVEIATALLFALPVFFRPPSAWLLFDGVVFGLLLALALIDVDWRLLPDDLTLLLMVLGAAGFMRPGGPHSPLAALWGGAAGLALPLLMRWSFGALRGREMLGLGDVKLFGAVGLLFGPMLLIWVMLFSALLGIAGTFVFALCYARFWQRRQINLGPAPPPAARVRRAYWRGFTLFQLPYGTWIALACLPAYFFAPVLMGFFG